jgi:hypothetical protein
VGWEGGPEYWSQFEKADNAGWSDPSFFPIAAWAPRRETDDVQTLMAQGVNTAMCVEHSGSDITPVTDEGMFCMLQHSNTYNGNVEWTYAQVGENPNVVSWFIGDECDMGFCGFSGTEDQYGYLNVVEAQAALVRAYDDGRFVWTNFGNGIIDTFWAPDTMDDMLAAVDGASVDKYCYTSPHVAKLWAGDLGITSPSPRWTAAGGTNYNDAAAATASTYGLMARELRYQWGSVNERSIWVFTETKRPLLYDPNTPDPDDIEPGSTCITYAQLEGAVWAGLVNEARGIAYFPPNNQDPDNPGAPLECSGGYSLVDCEQGLKDAVTAVNGMVLSLAPVLNTQSYEWDFEASRVRTMLKAHEGYAYIFASLDIEAALGSKTFTLPPDLAGASSVEFVDGTGGPGPITITGGEFSVSFPNEYDHFIGRIAI